jgi:hypothetical protein
MKLYLVYRVKTDGERVPEAIMSFADVDLPNAGNIYDSLVRDDNPEMARQEGETWEFVAREEADRADWEEIAPPDSAAKPEAVSPVDDNSDLLSDGAASLLRRVSEDDPL